MMKRILAFLFALLFAVGAHATITEVQRVTSNAAGDQSVSVTSVGAGNTLLVFVNMGAGTADSVVGVSDGQGSYTALTNIARTTSADGGGIFKLENANSGTHTIVVDTGTAGSWGTIIVIEVSGVPTGGATDGATTRWVPLASFTNSTDGLSGTAITTTVNGDKIISVAAPTTTNETAAAGTGYTLGANFNGTVMNHVYSESKTQTTAGSVTATWTTTFHDEGWLVHTVALKPVVAATLSSPGSSSITQTTVHANVTSDTAGGTLYAVATSTNSAPTAAQIKAASGGTIVAGANATAVNGSNSITISGLTASTNYWLFFVQDNGLDSNIPTSSAFSTIAPAPNVTSISAGPWLNGASITLTGTTLKAAGSSTMTMGGCSQTITSQTATSITFTAARCTNKYGTTLNIIVTDSASSVGNTYTGMTGLSPQSGWSYLDLTTPNSTSSYRVTGSADIASGDQVAYDNKSGRVVFFPDGTFSVDPTGGSVTSFNNEFWTSGGWGTTATQTINPAVVPNKKKHSIPSMAF
jgi:hypothetical protein